MGSFNLRVFYNRQHDGRKFEVQVSYWPGEPAVWHYRNGDPGHEADPEEVGVVEVREWTPTGHFRKVPDDVLGEDDTPHLLELVRDAMEDLRADQSRDGRVVWGLIHDPSWD